jgi:hypothetical protein
LLNRQGYREAVERDKRWVSALNLSRLNNALWPLYVAFICLNFLDIYTTSIAMSKSQIFQEHNIIAAHLFAMNFDGFSLALILKFGPAIPLFYAVFCKDPGGRHSYHIRLVKVSALFALIAGDVFYCLVVLFNNIPVLLEGSAAAIGVVVVTVAALFFVCLPS